MITRVNFHRELVIQDVNYVVQVNIKFLLGQHFPQHMVRYMDSPIMIRGSQTVTRELLNMHVHGAEMGPYQQEKQMQNVVIVSLENKNNPIRTLNAIFVFQANIVWQVKTMNV